MNLFSNSEEQKHQQGKLSHVLPQQPTPDRALEKYLTPLISLHHSKQHSSVPRPALQTPINPLTCSSALSHTPAILYTAPTHILVQQFKPHLSPTHPP